MRQVPSGGQAPKKERAIGRLAEFAARTPASGVPAELKDRARDCVLDAAGAAAAGFDHPGPRAVRNAMIPMSASGNSAVWFSGLRAAAIAAAGSNAAAATALDVDDGHRRAAGHPGAAVVSAALAGAEESGTDADQLLASVVIGYEASVRVALARNPGHHPSTASGRWCGVGAAAAYARLRGTDPAVMADAILIAEQHAPRIAAAQHHGFAGSDVKEGIPWAVVSGMTAVLLAENGFKGYPSAFDQNVLYDPVRLAGDLGAFSAMDGLFFKPYACCRWIHAAIDGALALFRDSQARAADIAEIEIRTFERAAKLGNDPAPRTESDAQFSIPFCVAAAVARGPESLLPMDPALMSDRDVLGLAGRIRVEFDDEMESMFPALAPARVAMRKGRRKLSTLVKHPFGDPGNPMDRAKIQSKFSALTSGVLNAERRQSLIGELASDCMSVDSLSGMLAAEFEAAGKERK